MKLHIRHDIDDRLLNSDAHELADLLPGPTLFELPGDNPKPLFISVLMHGNEPVGWNAVRRLLRGWQGTLLPRAISLFVGNIQAAAEGQRHLPEQPDYNRVWPGTTLSADPVAKMLAELTDHMRARQPVASIDLHNNTGRNPHYGCVNTLDPAFLSLAAAFSETVVYFLRPLGVQSIAFADFCPAVTLECGLTGAVDGIDHAADYLQRCLAQLNDDGSGLQTATHIDVYHTVATVKIAPQASFGFDCDDCSVNLVADIERYNFVDLPANQAWGKLALPLSDALAVTNENGERVEEQYFQIDSDRTLRNRGVITPAMLTQDTAIVRDDCLCYLMEPLIRHQSLTDALSTPPAK